MRRGTFLVGVVAVAVLGVSACATGNGADDPPIEGTTSDVVGDKDGDGFDSTKDCDDDDPRVHPGAAESCNGRDDNCDGKVDEGFDKDGDGYAACATSTKAADCNDDDPAVHPGAAETCNAKDDDCDGVVDNGFDQDGDGFFTCAHGDVAVDCDDKDAKVFPGAKEVCNAKDDDCNGKVDEIPAKITGLAPPLDPHWTVTGSASLATFGWGQLTPKATGQVGALWWNAGAPGFLFDSFEVTYTIWIKADTDGADGLAFAWVPGTDTTKVGLAGGGYGVQGLGGYAVAIDTFRNTDIGDPPVPYLDILDITTTVESQRHLTRLATIPNVRDGKEHTMKVKLDAGKLTVDIDKVTYLNEFVIPNYVPFSGHWGFAAATGGLAEEHWVKDITMSFPKGQACVP